MRLADKIREYVYKNYVLPARKRGDTQITVCSGNVHERMGLSSRLPAVCDALVTKKFEREYSVRLVNRQGPKHGANVYLTFDL